MDTLCTWVKLLTGLQSLGCKLHKNALPRPSNVIRGGREGEGKGWEWGGEEGKGTEGREWVGREQREGSTCIFVQWRPSS